jgi:hypothetical protein
MGKLMIVVPNRELARVGSCRGCSISYFCRENYKEGEIMQHNAKVIWSRIRCRSSLTYLVMLSMFRMPALPH